MKLLLLCIFSFAFITTAFAQKNKEIFDSASAKSFFADTKNLAESSTAYRSKGVKSYEEKDFETAAKFLNAAKFFALLDTHGAKLSDEQKSYLLANSDVLDEFVNIISPKDNLENVFKILADLWAIDNGDSFSKLPKIAIAFAIVYDTPPYLNWPHSQVSADLLPRKLPDHIEMFQEWISNHKRGSFKIRQEKLSIDEAKYLVPTLTSKEDREWARRIRISPSTVDKLYSSITYDLKRLNTKAFDWTAADYKLSSIKKLGGICTDQAYYTAEVAKAQGIPAFIFSGAGSTGFHAWAAYMKGPNLWNFEVGRYAEARFVTGHTIDPQTWEHASDHSLECLREGFRTYNKYRLNEIHTMFAELYFDEGNLEKAEAAAKDAIISDKRNIKSWLTLILISDKQQKPDAQIFSVYDGALKAFYQYPDIDAGLRKDLISRCKKAKKDDLAEKLTNTIIVRTKGARPDIAMAFARAELEAEIADGSTDKLYASYKRLLNTFKKDPAMAVNGIVIPIANKLIVAKKLKETEEFMKITRQVYKSVKETTFTSNLDSIDNQLKSIRNANSEDE